MHTCISCGASLHDDPDYDDTHIHGPLCWDCECPECGDQCDDNREGQPS